MIPKNDLYELTVGILMIATLAERLPIYVSESLRSLHVKELAVSYRSWTDGEKSDRAHI